MHITIAGFSGGLTALNTKDNADAISLALTLLLEGYLVYVNGIEVRVEYGPGYNTVIWAKGDFEGQPLQAS